MSTDALEVVPKVDVDQLDTAKPLPEIFQPFQATIEKWAAKVQSLRVTDISQRTEMEQARLARLDIKTARVNMEKTRVKLVEGLKVRSSKIDAFARGYRVKMEALEEELRESEEFAVRHAAKVKAELKVAREKQWREESETPVFGDLSDLSEEVFWRMLEDARILKQAKVDAAKKAEEERQARIKAEAEERKRIQEENALLKAEAEEKAKLAEIERQRIKAEREEEARLAEIERKRIEAERAEERKKMEAAHAEEVRKANEELRKQAEERKTIEAKAKADAAAAAKARAELAAKTKAEAEEKARIEAQRRSAEAAPDIEKLRAFSIAVRALPVPKFTSIGLDLSVKVMEWSTWVDMSVRKLEETGKL